MPVSASLNCGNKKEMKVFKFNSSSTINFLSAKKNNAYLSGSNKRIPFDNIIVLIILSFILLIFLFSNSFWDAFWFLIISGSVLFYLLSWELKGISLWYHLKKDKVLSLADAAIKKANSAR